MTYTRPEPLRESHGLEGFSCGERSLDDWLVRHARQAQAASSARIFVTTRDSSRVVGFYALAPAQIEAADATGRLLKGQPAERPVPVLLLARLAVDERHQGRGLGSSLLRDAMLRSEQGSKLIGGRALIVHALGESARRWYLQFGYEESPTDPHHLILLMKDLRRFLREAETTARPRSS